MSKRFEFELGEHVDVGFEGRVIGRSEFDAGNASYLVEFRKRNKVVQEWLDADCIVSIDMDVDMDDDDADLASATDKAPQNGDYEEAGEPA